LRLYRDIKDGISDGWTVDLVEAHTDSGPAGYIKLACISAAEMQRWYPTPLHWAVRKKGHYSGKYGTLGRLLDVPEN
jgi:hypothetical protein